jgi:hypothetical protein
MATSDYTTQIDRVSSWDGADVLWRVMRREKANGEVTTFIGCDLLEPPGWGGGWGYKDMTESMHPYYYSCPLEYLAMAPAACPAWREKVYEHHGKAPVQIEPRQEVSHG